ncbi:MAG: hypothetical protein H0X11_13635 [Betaproteobacteria bacterium]|nr:hypothetical protein [Betaproteobacteria bacterium]
MSRRALRHAEQREAGKTFGFHNGFKVGEPNFEGNVRNKATLWLAQLLVD